MGSPQVGGDAAQGRYARGVLAGEAPSTAARTLGDEIDDRKSAVRIGV
jgi:hypothetical protein